MVLELPLGGNSRLEMLNSALNGYQQQYDVFLLPREQMREVSMIGLLSRLMRDGSINIDQVRGLLKGVYGRDFSDRYFDIAAQDLCRAIETGSTDLFDGLI